MFLAVVGDKVYGKEKNVAGKHPLVSVTVDAQNAITITDEGQGIDALPSSYILATPEEVIAMFGITSSAGYKPPANIVGNDPAIIYLDEANKVVTLTVSDPAEGDFSDVASSDTKIATVTEAGGVFTIVPVAVGVCNVTAKWTPTDTDFATSTVTIPVVVAKRQIEFAPIRDQRLTKNVNKTITLTPNVSSGSALSYIVDSTDTAICSPAMSVEDGHGNDLVLTVPVATPQGEATISVSASDTNGKAFESEVVCFKVRVHDSAVTITAIDDVTLKSGESEEITVVCAGAGIREVTTSDAAHVTVEKTDTLKLKVTAVGAAGDSATITVYCDKRGYGEASKAFTVTVS